MTIKRIKLTEHLIRSFKKGDKSYNVWDTVERNLYVSVSKKNKTYIFYKRNPLKQVRKHLGNVKDIKLTDARKQANKLLKSFQEIKINDNNRGVINPPSPTNKTFTTPPLYVIVFTLTI